MNGDWDFYSCRVDDAPAWNFADRESRDRFVADVASLGFSVRSEWEGEGARPFGVQFQRRDVPALDRIDDLTLPLFDAARARGGECEGWECAVLGDRAP